MKKDFLKQDFRDRPIVSENAAGALFSGVLRKTDRKALKNG
jgi:hypothetical protein